MSFSQAFLPAAGFGRRMKPLTDTMPKPLLRVGGIPLIYYALYHLTRWKIRRIVINTHYLGDQIESALRDFNAAEICFSREPEILGTAGGLARAFRDFLDREQPCVLINPDVIFDARTEPPMWRHEGDEAHTLLSLRPKLPGSPEPGWFFEEKSDRIRMNRQGGEFFYAGLAALNSAVVSDCDPDKFAELGPLWEVQAAAGKVSGFALPSEPIFAGNAEEYAAASEYRRDDAEWKAFLKQSGLPLHSM